MLPSAKAAASQRNVIAPFEPGRRTPVGHASPHTPLVGGGVTAAKGAGEAQGTAPASPAPVLISERLVVFATAAAGIASQTAATRRPRTIPSRRPSDIERAVLPREMERP